MIEVTVQDVGVQSFSEEELAYQEDKAKHFRPPEEKAGLNIALIGGAAGAAVAVALLVGAGVKRYNDKNNIKTLAAIRQKQLEEQLMEDAFLENELRKNTLRGNRRTSL